ncbi:MAG: family transporter, partial [Frankiales bacterium]|nr:family transporter [Frankiales bacterium]
MRTLALFSFRRRRLVLAAWLGTLVVMIGLIVGIGAGYSDDFSLPDTESSRAYDLLKQVSPTTSGDQLTVVAAVEQGTIRDDAPKKQLADTLTRLDALDEVTAVQSPYTAGGEGQISQSGRIAFAPVTLHGRVPNDLDATQIARVVDLVKAASTDDVEIHITGPAAAAGGEQGLSEIIGLVAAAVVLFLVFGSLIAMSLPLITAVLSIAISISLAGLAANVVNVASFAPILSALLGLGVGVDYALFIVTRYRQGLMDGLTPEEATAEAIDTSGRAVLFAGMVVCIAILGLFALGISFFYGVAIAAALSVATTVFASLTLLPALLGFFGRKVL